MKFTGNTQTIAEGVGIVSRALNSKPINPMFDGILTEVNGTFLSLLASDGQMSIRWTGNVTGQEDGLAVIQGKLLAEFLRRLPSGDTTISTDDTAAHIACGRSRTRLALIPGTFPEGNEKTPTLTTTIPAQVLKDLITFTIPSIATDQTRVILTGALFSITPDDITAVSLDGFRLAIRTHTQHNLGSAKVVVPRRALSELARILPSSDAPVMIQTAPGSVSFHSGNTILTTATLAGEFVDYSHILPKDASTIVTLHADALRNAADRVSLIAREGKNNLIQMEVGADTISLSSASQSGSANESVDVITNGAPLSIAFNVAYISDALRIIQDDLITIRFSSPVAPAVIRPEHGDSWTYLLLPVRVR